MPRVSPAAVNAADRQTLPRSTTIVSGTTGRAATPLSRSSRASSPCNAGSRAWARRRTAARTARTATSTAIVSCRPAPARPGRSATAGANTHPPAGRAEYGRSGGGVRRGRRAGGRAGGRRPGTVRAPCRARTGLPGLRDQGLQGLDGAAWSGRAGLSGMRQEEASPRPARLPHWPQTPKRTGHLANTTASRSRCPFISLHNRWKRPLKAAAFAARPSICTRSSSPAGRTRPGEGSRTGKGPVLAWVEGADCLRQEEVSLEDLRRITGVAGLDES